MVFCEHRPDCSDFIYTFLNLTHGHYSNTRVYNSHMILSIVLHLFKTFLDMDSKLKASHRWIPNYPFKNVSFGPFQISSPTFVLGPRPWLHKLNKTLFWFPLTHSSEFV